MYDHDNGMGYLGLVVASEGVSEDGLGALGKGGLFKKLKKGLKKITSLPKRLLGGGKRRRGRGGPMVSPEQQEAIDEKLRASRQRLVDRANSRVSSLRDLVAKVQAANGDTTDVDGFVSEAEEAASDAQAMADEGNDPELRAAVSRTDAAARRAASAANRALADAARKKREEDAEAARVAFEQQRQQQALALEAARAAQAAAAAGVPQQPYQAPPPPGFVPAPQPYQQPYPQPSYPQPSYPSAPAAADEPAPLTVDEEPLPVDEAAGGGVSYEDATAGPEGRVTTGSDQGVLGFEGFGRRRRRRRRSVEDELLNDGWVPLGAMAPTAALKAARELAQGKPSAPTSRRRRHRTPKFLRDIGKALKSSLMPRLLEQEAQSPPADYPAQSGGPSWGMIGLGIAGVLGVGYAISRKKR